MKKNRAPNTPPADPAVERLPYGARIRGTDFVVYQVSDLARAAAFYRDLLGLPQEIYSEQWHWAEFNCGNVTLALHAGLKLPKKIAGGRIALAVDDVAALSAALQSKGVRVIGEPVDYSICQAVEILDPDGNTVILHHRANGTVGQNSEPQEKQAATILDMERAALDRWAKGDPSGFLEICAPDVVYFDPSLDDRLDGLHALSQLYERVRGQIHLSRFELLNPKMQFAGDAAVLTYNFTGRAGARTDRWNCTEVYQRTPDGWRIIQTHWSRTRPVRK
jgi:predicted enzyme related to lactoylglutathione lyase/ketosteroid isomerase-like protein